VNHDFERVADFEELRFDGERELAERKHAFGFSADVDEQFVFIFLDDRAGQNLAFVENFERLFVELLFESELIFFGLNGSDFSRRDVGVPTFVLFFIHCERYR
jgi:hypothetical protein